MIDLAKVRADTAGCEAVAHFNNAGSSLPPRPVVESMIDYLRAEELAGGYELATERATDLDEIYAATSRYLNCDPSEVAFGVSAGDGWWRAFTSIPMREGDRILVGHSEYQANAFGWIQARDRGIIVDVVPNDPAGVFDLEAFESMLDERVKLVSLTMVAMSNGAVHPAAAVGKALKDAGSDAIYLLDACQAAGQMPLDVQALGCDFMNYTGRKFMRGPRGTGILFARSDVHERLGHSPFVDGRSATWSSIDDFDYASDAKRFEFGEYGYAAKVGFGVATNYMLNVGVDAIEERVTQLAGLLRFDLSAITKVRVLDQGVRQCGIVTFEVEGLGSADVQAKLRAAGFNLSGPAASMAQLDLTPRSLTEVVRAGVHYFNSEEEVANLCMAVAEL